MARPVDVSPSGPLALPIIGIGSGWEPAAILTLTLLLLSLGLVTLYSASAFLAQGQALPDYYYVLRQATGAAAGLAILGVCAWIPHDLWRQLSLPMVVVAWLLLIFVILPSTETIAPLTNGARRWIRFGGLRLQPSELAKVAVVVWTAARAVRKQDEFSSLSRGLVPFLLVWAALMVPIALEPDLSTALLVGVIGCLVVYVAGARLTHFVFLGLLAAPVLYSQLDVAFRARRVLAYLNPSADPTGAGFQVQQSLLAFGSGGVAGVGFGQGRQKFGFLPEAHNDFIFAMIGEEWGLIGVTATVLLYLLLILIGFRVASRAPDLFGQLLAVGLTSTIALQAILHMAVGLRLVPATGLVLPLISYGRSHLVVTLASLGILMSISRARGLRGRGPPLPGSGNCGRTPAATSGRAGVLPRCTQGDRGSGAPRAVAGSSTPSRTRDPSRRMVVESGSSLCSRVLVGVHARNPPSNPSGVGRGDGWLRWCPCGLGGGRHGDTAGAPGAERMARSHDSSLVAVGSAGTPRVCRGVGEITRSCTEGVAGFRVSDPNPSRERARPARCASRHGIRVASEAPAGDRRKPRIPCAERVDAGSRQVRGRRRACRLG